MSLRINQAVNRVTLTNVAIVRLKRNGKRYEVACYANKISQYRQGQETLEETLQTTHIFENVTKATLYRKAQLVEAFGTDNEEAICKIILEKGVAQITGLEREHEHRKMIRNVATLISSMCVNANTLRPYPVSTIETALRENVHFSVDMNRSAKQQAVEAIRKLEACMPLKRAQMLVKALVTKSNLDALKDKLKESKSSLMNNTQDDPYNESIISCSFLLDPGHFRNIVEFVGNLQPPGTLEVVDFSVRKEHEADVDTVKSVADAMKKVSVSQPVKPGKLIQEQNQCNREKSRKQDAVDTTNEEIPETTSRALKAARKKNKKKERKQQRREGRAENLRSATNQESHVLSDQNMEASEVESEAPNDIDQAKADSGKEELDTKFSGDGLRCMTCRIGFKNDRELQRSHYRSDIHRANLKLKSKSLPTLTVDEFDTLTEEEKRSIIIDYV